MSQFSPIHSSQTTAHASGAIPPGSQTTTHTPSTIPPGINPSTPPRLNTSGISGVTELGVDLLDDQGANTSRMSVAGTFIPLPSPRQNTRSPETHQLQQTLRNSASELVRTCSSSSDSGDGASAFASLQASNTSAVVETVQEGGSDDEEDVTRSQLGSKIIECA